MNEYILYCVHLRDLFKVQKLKLQQQQQQQVAAAVAAAAQNQQAAGTQPATQVQAAQAAQANPQLTAVAAPRPGTVLTGTTVTNLQVARLVTTPFFTFGATEPSTCSVVLAGQLWDQF